MSCIRQPTSAMADQVVIMKLAMLFNGDMHHDIDVVEWFCRRYRVPETVALSIIEGHWPTNATDSIH